MDCFLPTLITCPGVLVGWQESSFTPSTSFGGIWAPAVLQVEWVVNLYYTLPRLVAAFKDLPLCLLLPGCFFEPFRRASAVAAFSFFSAICAQAQLFLHTQGTSQSRWPCLWGPMWSCLMTRCCLCTSFSQHPFKWTYWFNLLLSKGVCPLKCVT